MSGNVVENSAGLTVLSAVGFVVTENKGTSEALRPTFKWRSKPCSNVVPVRPLQCCGENSDMNQRSLQASLSPTREEPTFSPTRGSFLPSVNMRDVTRPFSFDFRDTMQRLAREEWLEEQRQIKETQIFTFRAHPVRKYKPLVLKQSTQPLTIPRSPFSRRNR